MTTQPKAAKVPNVTTRAGILDDSDVNIGSYLAAADKRNLRLVSKAFNQAFLDNLKCADAQELQDMHKEPEPCRNTAKIIYNPEKGMQRAIMCAIMSEKQDAEAGAEVDAEAGADVGIVADLHVYVIQDNLKHFLDSQSVKCFDKNYALKLTLLFPRDPQTKESPEPPPPQPEELRCAGKFLALKYGFATGGRLENQEGVQVVRFTGNTLVPPRAFARNQTLQELLDVDKIERIHREAFAYCSRLNKLGDMPELRRIGGWAFDSSSLGEVGNMPKLKTMSTHAFAVTNLAKVGNMPELEQIGYSAFLQCMSLEEVGNMRNLKQIKEMAFYNCRLLKKVGDMPHLKQIEEMAFSGCDLLERIFLPKTLQHVRGEAFKDCPLSQLSVEPGAKFDCYCENLAMKIRSLRDVNVTGHRPPYIIQAFSLPAQTTQGLTTRQIRLLLQKSNEQA